MKRFEVRIVKHLAAEAQFWMSPSKLAGKGRFGENCCATEIPMLRTGANAA
jgi:hypothetical protein